MTKDTRCTVSDDNGDCFKPVVDGCPISLCARHLIMAHTFAQGLVEDRMPPARTGGKPRFRHFEPAVVYYIRLDGKIKIGTSTNLPLRMKAIRHEELMAVEPGSLEVESARHRQFEPFRVEGEWFEASMPLLRHVVVVREKFGDPWKLWESLVAERTTAA